MTQKAKVVKTHSKPTSILKDLYKPGGFVFFIKKKKRRLREIIWEYWKATSKLQNTIVLLVIHMSWALTVPAVI